MSMNNAECVRRMLYTYDFNGKNLWGKYLRASQKYVVYSYGIPIVVKVYIKESNTHVWYIGTGPYEPKVQKHVDLVLQQLEVLPAEAQPVKRISGLGLYRLLGRCDEVVEHLKREEAGMPVCSNDVNREDAGNKLYI